MFAIPGGCLCFSSNLRKGECQLTSIVNEKDQITCHPFVGISCRGGQGLGDGFCHRFLTTHVYILTYKCDRRAIWNWPYRNWATPPRPANFTVLILLCSFYCAFLFVHKLSWEGFLAMRYPMRMLKIHSYLLKRIVLNKSMIKFLPIVSPAHCETSGYWEETKTFWITRSPAEVHKKFKSNIS